MARKIRRISILQLIIAILVAAELAVLYFRTPVKHGACPGQVVCPKRMTPAPSSASVSSASVREVTEDPSQSNLPYYDMIGVLFAIASEHDLLRMEAAEKTWLAWKDPKWSFHWMVVLCQDDPGLGPEGCTSGPDCVRSRKHVVVVPCKQGYKSIVTKSAEGFRYVASNFRFKYLMKADIDTMVDMRCIKRAIEKESPRCPSFGFGAWRMARSSKVFRKNDPGAGKYVNEPFVKDSGFKYYPPYMVGQLNVWSADVARFIGMAGLPSKQMPHWKSSWTIDDAAIGSFVIGLNICRLHNPCHVVTDVEAEQFEWRYKGDVTGHALPVKKDYPVNGFEGPLADDVPGLGDLGQAHTKNLEECAAKCQENPECRSFEHSPTQGMRADVKNCQLATGTHRSGRQAGDFSLYLKKASPIEPDGPVDGFEGPIDDDVPGTGDLDNVFTKTLQECADKCKQHPRCKSFEHSPSYRKTAGIKSCQLNTGTHRAGTKFEDFNLYVRVARF